MKRIKKYIGAAMMGGVLLALPSCSDTWDDHYSAADSGDTSATETLWDIISSKPELSRFKDIAEKATYYRDETHPQANYTFKDMLEGSMLITAWVPENSAFTDTEYQNWLTLAETNGYTVQQQLLGNTIALWRQVATGGGVDTLTMLNGKKMVFDKTQFTMQDLPLLEKNIAAANGTLHTLANALPFRYSFYEYIKDANNANTNSVMKLHDYIVANDTTYFNEENSIEGNPDINGEPTYVDSAYITTNTMFYQTHRFPKNTNTDQYLTYDESFGANIIAEDSTFLMMMPSDKAWNDAYTMLEKYYIYANKYPDKEKLNQGGTASTVPPREVANPDSLKDKCINMDIISPLCYNLHFQPKGDNIGRWSLDDFLADNGASSDYFLNTFGDTLRTDSAWNKTELFKGTQIKLSNGVGFVSDEWNIPAKLYKPDVIVEIGYNTLFNTSGFKGGYRSFAFSNAAAAAWVDSVGRVSENNFYYVYPSTSGGNPEIEFRIVGTHGENRESEVMSGKYDVYAVMVPNFYMTSSDTISGDTLMHKFSATMYYVGNPTTGRDANKATPKVIEYDGKKVEEVLLWEDFEFPYSYKNLRQSFPTLRLTTKTTATERRNGYSNDFCIDRIILRSKD